MDKNSITGVILIILIVIGYNALFPPVVQEAQNIENTKKTVVIEEPNSIEKITDEKSEEDYENLYGSFANTSPVNNNHIVIENELLKLSISPKGGRIVSAILKD